MMGKYVTHLPKHIDKPYFYDGWLICPNSQLVQQSTPKNNGYQLKSTVKSIKTEVTHERTTNDT